MEPETLDPETILALIQALIPVLGPIVTGALRRLLDGLEGSTALYVNLALNLLAQLLAALTTGGASITTAAVLGVGGGLAGSKGRDVLRGKTRAVA